MREEADSAWAEKGALGVRGQGRQGAAGTKYTPRKKSPQGSARGQCPVVLYERKGGREQQDGGRAEKRSGQKAAGRNRKRPSYVGGTESSVKNLNM